MPVFRIQQPGDRAEEELTDRIAVLIGHKQARIISRQVQHNGDCDSVREHLPEGVIRKLRDKIICFTPGHGEIMPAFRILMVVHPQETRVIQCFNMILIHFTVHDHHLISCQQGLYVSWRG